MTPERFARVRTFEEYVRFIGSPENLAREGFDVRRFSLTRPRIDWSGYLRERYAGARLSDDQTAAVRWLAAQPGGPAKIAAIAEDWSSDCRRDLPYLARLAEAGGLELRVFVRDGDTMLRKGLPDPAAGGNADLVVAYANDKNGQQCASVPVAIAVLERVGRAVQLGTSSPPSTTWIGCSVTRAARSRETEEQTSARQATSAGCSSPRSSTCGRSPPSPRSSARSTNGG